MAENEECWSCMHERHTKLLLDYRNSVQAYTWMYSKGVFFYLQSCMRNSVQAYTWMYSKGVFWFFFICRVAWLWKMTLRSSQDSNLGSLNSGQMLLPMSYWSSGIGAEDRWHLSIDTDRLSGWISLRLGKLCRVNTEVLCAATTELDNSSSYFVCAVRALISKGRPETFLLPSMRAPCNITKRLTCTVIMIAFGAQLL